MRILFGVSRAVVFFCGLALSFSSFAWDGSVTGKISRVDAVGSSGGAPGNLDFRISIENQTNLCGGTNAANASFAFINSNDANYKGIVAMVLMAQAQGKAVQVYTNRTSAGYCQIGFISIPS